MTDDDCRDCLVAWERGVESYLRRDVRRNKNARDIVQQFVLKLLENERMGVPIPSSSEEALASQHGDISRIAKRMSFGCGRRFVETGRYLHNKWGSTSITSDASDWLLEKVETTFPGCMDRWLTRCADSEVTQKWLAESAGIPYRTFKHKCARLKCS